MAGYSSKVATATWVGNVAGQTSQSNKSINGRAVSTIRHLVWREIMAEVNRKYGGDPFPRAEGRYISGRMLTVPDLTNSETESAESQLITIGLNYSIEGEVPSSAPVGTVAYTIPAAGDSAVRGSIVQVFVSGGGLVVVPDISGLALEEAAATLQALGLTVTFPQESQTLLLTQCNPNIAPGLSYGTLPAAGESIAPSSALVLIPNSCG
jgi:membrane peptidoglycan carboxypeptidase